MIELLAEELVRTVCLLEPTFGGVNLEDIKGPDCFYVEEECKKRMKIPVFHDDQHGTAIICLAGIINVLKMKKMNITDAKIVMVGAGAAGIACMNMVKVYGADPKKVSEHFSRTLSDFYTNILVFHD